MAAEPNGQQRGQRERNPNIERSAAEISRDHWTRFFDKFSKDHLGAPASVEIRGTQTGGAHQICRSMPLMGVTYSPKDDPELVEIALEESPEGANLTHVVKRPAHVWHLCPDKGREVLELEAEDGTTTVLQLEGSAA
jgi:hypothetical protein